MSQRLIKLATSLHMKKYRDREELFLAEGEKLVLSLIENGLDATALLCLEDWAIKNPFLDCTVVDSTQMKKVSNLKTNTKVVGLFKKIEHKDEISFPALILDRIQDPGNLGTIIRTAAWFGFNHIYCSLDTVDCYNPKVVQATMGALAMVDVEYVELIPLVQSLKEKKISIYGTFLGGKNIYTSTLSVESATVIGNEGSGISEALAEYIDEAITIPSMNTRHPESLNASVSTAIVCSEIYRNRRFSN